MKNSKSFTTAAIALFALLFTTVAEEAEGQVRNVYRGSIKAHTVKPPRLKKRPPLTVPDGLLEVSREHILKTVPPCDISPAERIGIAPLPSPMPRPGHARIGIAPLPSPMPRPGYARIGIEPNPSPMPRPGHARIGIEPNPSPMPRPGYERIGIMPLPSPMPRPEVSRAGFSVGPVSSRPAPAEGVDSIIDPIYIDIGPAFSPSLLDLLIDLHAEAVRQGDLGGADLLEELIVVWPQF
ncbi:MAG: hypothetical protein ABGX05_00110 [Pirellulaceae bacterium]